MLDFVRELRALIGPLTLDVYLGQRVLNLATEKLSINLGEAAQRISEKERMGIPNVPWRQIIGLRNILAHGYEQIEHASLHRTVQEELTEVELALSAALALRGDPDHC